MTTITIERVHNNTASDWRLIKLHVNIFKDRQHIYKYTV